MPAGADPTQRGAVPGVRDRLVSAAAELTCEAGWSAVTMGKVAARAGVSRQTLYNELGSKPELGQAMVLSELERFLDIVGSELDAHDDLVEAIRSAAYRVLVVARDNPLLRAILTSAHSVSRGAEQPGGSELLPFLTTDAQPLIEAATAVIAQRLPERYPGIGLDEHERDVTIDAVVRLVLSHVMEPGEDPRATADALAWIVARVVRQAPLSRPRPR